MISINYKDPRPIYTQIKDGLRRLILTGVLPPGEKLQSVRELAAELAINPNTIQRAYRELEAEGYILSIAGKGSFVADTKRPDAEELTKAVEAFHAAANALRELGMQKSELYALLNESEAKEEYK